MVFVDGLGHLLSPVLILDPFPSMFVISLVRRRCWLAPVPYRTICCYSATWAMGPVCGLNNKQAMVRVVLQLLHHTVEANGMQMSTSLALEGET